MDVEHKLLSTGWHHVRAVGYHHLYAQFPRSTQCDHRAVSAGEMPPSPEVIDEFISAANRAAEQHSPEQKT